MKKISLFVTALLMVSSAITSSAAGVVSAEDTNYYEMNVNVDMADGGKAISPYIYGINDHGLDGGAQANAVRQGGNRYTAYNWETNYSNAGSDWHNSSDDYLSISDVPGACATKLSEEAQENNIAYKLATLQMCGYVSADKSGEVSAEEAAPSERWNKVVAKKDGELSLTPDLTDGVVYMDEYVNYLVDKLGDSKTATGIQAYSLDNEPALWSNTHSLIHPGVLSRQELIDKSVELAKAVKDVDSNAEIFGPALYGYTAYDHLQDDDEWKANKGDYDWFISYYLDEMKKAEEESGKRLLDVLDIHYYTEAKGTCDTRMCEDPTHTECIDEMLQSYRTLCEEGYVENSWIGQWCQPNIPILKRMQESIANYYPGTKLALTEYSFGGGNHIAGGIAEIDALGTFAKNDVYFASLWADDAPYQYSGINMFTNFDGKGTAFGDTLIDSKTDDYVKSTSYAAVNGTDKGDVTLIVTNKNQTETEKATINLANADTQYKNAAVYVLTGESSKIVHMSSLDKIDDNTFTVDIPPLSAVQILVTDDESSYRPVEEPPTDITVSTGKVSGKLTGGEEGKYKVSFDQAMGDKVVIDMTIADGVAMASGGMGFNATYDGVDYWVSCPWETKASGEVICDLSKPTSAYNAATDKSTDDKELLANLAELIVKEKTADFQVWYVANSSWESIDPSNVTINDIYINVPLESKMYGDLNADGVADMTDMTMMSLKLLGDINFTENQLFYADVNGDGNFDLADLSHMKQYIMKEKVILGKQN
ncbi:MAG: glycoside hydrolase family 44 protein [Oscillospiraceae bacterium]|nr:glycoside hydrolase family 44 protein [Oscillospiraceae bacterium]